MADKYALLIGNDFFSDTRLASLFAPRADINGLAEVLADLQIGEIPQENIRVVMNSQLEAVQENLHWLFARRNRDDLIIFYYSGHGLRDDHGRLYLALTNSKQNQPAIGSLQSGYVRQSMDDCGSCRQLVLLDCCHAGAFAGNGGFMRRAAGPEPVLNQATFEPEGQGRFVMAASTAAQSAFEKDGKSLYTHHIVEGLRTGDAAPEKDVISVADLQAYVTLKVAAAQMPMQPHYWADQQTLPLVLARNPHIRKGVDEGVKGSIASDDPIVRLGAIGAIEDILSHGAKGTRREAFNLLRARIADPNETIRVARAAAHVLARQGMADELELAFSAWPAKGGGADAAEQARAEAELATLRAERDELAAELARQRAALDELTAQSERQRSLIATLTENRSGERGPSRAQPTGKAGMPAGTLLRSDYPVCPDWPEMLYIPGGRFTMGSPRDETDRQANEKLHEVRIADFALARNAVTFDQWRACLEDGGCGGYLPDDEDWGRGDRPVINVSWKDAEAYLDWMNARVPGSPYRLPSEAEWEYACRAGTTTPFSFGETLSTDQANYDGDFAYGAGAKGVDRQKTVPVSDLDAANPWGLRHMHGNVWEWVEDVYEADYGKVPSDGLPHRPERIAKTALRVLRGGSWYNDPPNLRAAYRSGYIPTGRVSSTGFRVARSLRPH